MTMGVLTFLLQSVQRFYVQRVFDVLQLLKRRVFLAPLDASIVITIEPRSGSDFRLGKSSLFTGFPELLAELFPSGFLIFASHIWINIPFSGRRVGHSGRIGAGSTLPQWLRAPA